MKTGSFRMIVCAGLVLVTVLTHIYALDAPIVDNHAFHQTERMSIADEMASGRAGFFSPKTLVSYQTRNMSRLFLANPPLYEYALSFLIRLTHTDVFAARYVSILSAIGIVMGTAIVAAELFGWPVGALAGLLVNASPLFAFWGQAVSPEMFAAALGMLALAHVFSTKRYSVLSFILLTVAVCTKPYFIVYMVPAAMYLYYERRITFSFSAFYAALASLPMSLWILWVHFLPKDTVYPFGFAFYIAPDGLWKYLTETQWPDVFLRERLLNSVTTSLGGALLIGSVIYSRRNNPSYRILIVWFLASVAGILGVAWENYNHDYNQIFLVPVVSIFIAVALRLLFLSVRRRPVLFRTAAIALLGLSGYFFWYLPFMSRLTTLRSPLVRYFEYQTSIQEVRRHIPFGSYVLVANGENNESDPSILFHIHAYGWVIPSDKFCVADPGLVARQYKNIGASYLLFFPQHDYTYVAGCSDRKNASARMSAMYRTEYSDDNVTLYAL